LAIFLQIYPYVIDHLLWFDLFSISLFLAFVVGKDYFYASTLFVLSSFLLISSFFGIAFWIAFLTGLSFSDLLIFLFFFFPVWSKVVWILQHDRRFFVRVLFSLPFFFPFFTFPFWL